MADIELRERFFGAGPVASIDLSDAPTLSWSEHNALLDSATQLRSMRGALEDLGLDMRGVVRAVDSLEAQLGLQLDQQTMLLDRQVDLLADIAQSLRTPARVRAAERLASTGELLRRKRFDRALAAAEQAIADDPNNPAAFIAAGWAHIGLGRLDEARKMFIEAAEASDGDSRSMRIRQIARLTLALDGATAALLHVEGAPTYAQGARERAAVAYDRCVYLAQEGDDAAAQAALLDAGRDQPSFLMRALTDPLLAQNKLVIEAASRELKTRGDALATAIAGYDYLILRVSERAEQVEDAEKTLRTPGKEERRLFLSKIVAIASRHREEREDLVAAAQGALQADLLSPGIVELQDALERIETFDTEVISEAIQTYKLERVVLDFATSEDALPMKLQDGTWEIIKKRRFGQDAKWRASISPQGDPVIEADLSARDDKH